MFSFHLLYTAQQIYFSSIITHYECEISRSGSFIIFQRINYTKQLKYNHSFALYTLHLVVWLFLAPGDSLGEFTITRSCLAFLFDQPVYHNKLGLDFRTNLRHIFLPCLYNLEIKQRTKYFVPLDFISGSMSEAACSYAL